MCECGTMGLFSVIVFILTSINVYGQLGFMVFVYVVCETFGRIKIKTHRFISLSSNYILHPKFDYE